jgi:hypothetical protein
MPQNLHLKLTLHNAKITNKIYTNNLKFLIFLYLE